jgi:O-antigen ligase
MFIAFAYLLFCLVCAVLAFRRHPIYAFYLYLSTTFVYPQGRYWGHLFVPLRPALLAAIITGLAIVLHMGKLRPKPFWLTNVPAVILTTYAALMWLQTPWALALDEHLQGSLVYAKSLLTFWMVYRIVDSKEKLRDLLFALVLGCMVLGVYAQFTGREGNRLDGVGGPGIDDANSLGMYLASGAVVAVGLVLSQRGWLRYVVLACLVIIFNGVVLANSRGSVIGLGAGLLALMLIKAREHRRMFWAFAAAAAIAQTAIVDQTFINRLLTVEDVTASLDDKNADNSALSRVALADAQILMFKDHPLGVGHRGTAALSPHYLEDRWMSQGNDFIRQRSSHNTFLTTLVEQGVFGAMLFVALILWILRSAYRIRRLNGVVGDPELLTLGGTACAALIVIYVSGISTDYLLAENQFWLLAALVSMLLIARQERRASSAARNACEPVGVVA